MYEERIEEVINLWDVLLVVAEDFSLWEEEDFDQELFRETMYETWKLFAEKIDFDAEEKDYVLPISLAVLLGKVMTYSEKRQYTGRPDGGNIGLSALIARDMYYSIEDRNLFVRDNPVVSNRHLIRDEVLRLTYFLETGELKVENGDEVGTGNYVYNIHDGSMRKIKPQLIEPIILKDITHWWFDDSEEYDDEEEFDEEDDEEYEGENEEE